MRFDKRVRNRAWPGFAAPLLAAILAVQTVQMVGVSTAAQAETVPLASAPSRAATDLAMDQVLVVRSADREDGFLGSAFIWAGVADIAVTNAHVVGTAEEVRVTDRQGNVVIATVIGRDSTRDVAILQLEPGLSGPDGAALTGIGISDAPPLPGLEVYALGAPLGAEFTLTRGMVSAMARQIDLAVPLMFLQHDAAVNPGSSGGPLVDAAGRLMGMNSRIADGSRMFVGIAYAISGSDLRRIVDGLIDESLLPFPKLGLNARPMERRLADTLGVPAEGLLVDAVSPGGLAASAGILAGDIILSVNGTKLQNPGDFAFLLDAVLAGGSAGITLSRAGENLTLVLDFSAAAPEPGLIGLTLRGPEDASPAPERIRSYRLAALGVVQGEDGRVSDLTINSPAALAGLAKGDRIRAVNGAAMDGAGLDALEITAATLLLVEAPDGVTRHLWLDPWGTAAGPRAIGGANVLDPAVVVF
ncbi:trypsin-like peptidase domain-containing protein [Pseudomonas sp. GX19020]|uniref:trypsin-like peptidase domain-containing protein n=1 Tax=Pseudomonas sp. GX19020 TaxID=2942277 RepID=UPI002018E4EB|nr:trypsin-like peptidase domain-containing protein [Pseudomonas sp. GX19020]MCL4065857.1 trypsin-like peptidase domain-containing protein [Pseudomonas sp. GX19020]